MNIQKPNDIVKKMRELIGESIFKKPHMTEAYNEVNKIIARVEKGEESYSTITKAVTNFEKKLVEDGSVRQKMPEFKKMKEQMNKDLAKWATKLDESRAKQSTPRQSVVSRASDESTKSRSTLPNPAKSSDEKRAKADLKVAGNGIGSENEMMDALDNVRQILQRLLDNKKSQDRYQAKAAAPPKATNKKVIGDMEKVASELTQLREVKVSIEKENEQLKSQLKSKSDSSRQLEDDYKALEEDTRALGDCMDKCMNAFKQNDIISFSETTSRRVPKEKKLASTKGKVETFLTGITNLEDTLARLKRESEEYTKMKSDSTRLTFDNSKLEELVSSLQVMVEKHKSPQRSNTSKSRKITKGQQKEREPPKLTVEQKCTALQNEISDIDQRLGELSSLQESFESEKNLMSKHEKLSEEYNASLEIIEALEKLLQEQKPNNGKKKGKTDTGHSCVVSKKTVVIEGINLLETSLRDLHTEVAKYTHDIESLKKELLTREEKIKELENETARFSEVKNIATKADRKKKDMEAEKKEKSLEKQIDELNNTVKRQQDAAQQLGEEKEKQQQELERCSADYNELEKKLQSKNKDIEDLSDEIKKMSVATTASKKTKSGSDIGVENDDPELSSDVTSLVSFCQDRLQELNIDTDEVKEDANPRGKVQWLKNQFMRTVDAYEKVRKNGTQNHDIWKEALEEIGRISREQKELEGTLLKIEHVSLLNKLEALHNQYKDIHSKAKLVRETLDNMDERIKRESSEDRPHSSADQATQIDKILDKLNGISEEQVELLRRARTLERNLDQQTDDVKRRQSASLREAENMSELNRNLKQQVQQITTEKEYWVNRYSQLAGANLSDNNAGIADLSDPDRPSKLAEKMSELYSNEWNEAFETIARTKKHSEKESITILLKILKSTFKYCKETAKQQMEDLNQILMFTEVHNSSGKNRDANPEFLNSQTRQHVKDARKSLARRALIAVIQRFVSDPNNTERFKFELQSCRLYLEACLEVCWLMCVQDPPVALNWSAKHSHNFDKNMFRFYTKSGNKFDYVVWPAILVQEGGAILSKGIAQPI